MNKSLRNWLASICLLATPGAVFGQNYVGQPYLAPVALEARCRVADGMLDSWPNFHSRGIDPLRFSATDTATSETDAEIVADLSKSTDSVAKNHGTRTSYQRGSDFCPLADFAVDFEAQDLDIQEACTPKDETEDLTAIVVNDLQLAESHACEYDCDAQFNCVEAAFASATQSEESADESVNYEDDCSDWLCGFTDEQIAAYHATEADLLADLESEIVAEQAAKTIPSAENAADNEQAVANQEPSDRRTPGCSPIIFSLQEEYLAYDLNADDVKREHPIKISLLNLPAPKYCMVPADVLLPLDTSAMEIAEVQAVSSDKIQPLDLAEYLPSEQQLEFLKDLAQSMQPRLPLDCWMDELVWRASDLFAPGGDVEKYVNADLVGQTVAHLSSASLQQVVQYSGPLVSILKQPTKPAVQQPAFQQIAEQQPKGKQLAIAGNALIEVAQELETFAAALRSWGISMNRVAAAENAAENAVVR